jgi:hypothetical protein
MAGKRMATAEEAKALAHPDRWRIIRLTYDAALTNKELAERLGRDPATTLHHVRTLVATGFIEPQEPRRGARGAKEIPYRSTGKTWNLEVEDADAEDATQLAVLDAFRAEYFEAPTSERLYSRLALRLTHEQVEELQRRVIALVEEAASWGPVEGGEPWALFIAVHSRPDVVAPTPSRQRDARRGRRPS